LLFGFRQEPDDVGKEFVEGLDLDHVRVEASCLCGLHQCPDGGTEFVLIALEPEQPAGETAGRIDGGMERVDHGRIAAAVPDDGQAMSSAAIDKTSSHLCVLFAELRRDVFQAL